MAIVDIVDKDDNIIRKEELDKAHNEGLFHRAVHIFIINSKGEVLLQQRKSTKRCYPLFWQGSVGGQVDLGESYEDAAKRETEEEIGIEAELKRLGKIIVEDDIEHEIVEIFIGKSDGPFSFEEEEMEKVEWKNLEKLKEEKDKIKMTPHCKEGLNLIFKIIYKMPKERFKIIPASYLVLMRGNEVLMIRRYNTGYEDGNYSLVAGHLDGEETFQQAMIRETREEANIILKPEDIEVVHIMHRFIAPTESDLTERIDVFIRADKWTGELKNLEPHKCDDFRWFPIGSPPENTIPCVRQALECIQRGIFYSEFGFDLVNKKKQ